MRLTSLAQMSPENSYFPCCFGFENNILVNHKIVQSFLFFHYLIITNMYSKFDIQGIIKKLAFSSYQLISSFLQYPSHNQQKLTKFYNEILIPQSIYRRVLKRCTIFYTNTLDTVLLNTQSLHI